MTGTTIEALRLDGIVKRFGALTANDAVSLTLNKGEVVALLGENGAGKTTLMNILFGQYAPDSGTVQVLARYWHPAIRGPRWMRVSAWYINISHSLIT